MSVHNMIRRRQQYDECCRLGQEKKKSHSEVEKRCCDLRLFSGWHLLPQTLTLYCEQLKKRHRKKLYV